MFGHLFTNVILVYKLTYFFSHVSSIGAFIKMDPAKAKQLIFLFPQELHFLANLGSNTTPIECLHSECPTNSTPELVPYQHVWAKLRKSFSILLF